MRIAVASGKGGTGKTTVAVSVARSLAEEESAFHSGQSRTPGGSSLLFLDCDVEAPDAHLFLDPVIEERVPATVQIPVIDPDMCTACGDCAEACQFSALAVLGGEVLFLPELCHGCGSCTLICPEKAITEAPRELGILESGRAGGISFARGILNVGEALAVPVIRQLKEWARPADGQTTILDAPPGTSCPTVETLSGSDYVLLVTEPTPFGLHDLALAVDVLRELGVPGGVIINRDGIGDEGVEEYCAAESLPVLLRIPFEREIAEGIAQGRTLLDVRPVYRERFRALFQMISGRLIGAGSHEVETEASPRGGVT
jgi:MinD superfamily P-loop ATPase